jgi:hypothetical protein
MMGSFRDMGSMVLLLGLFVGSAAACHAVLPYLPERHRSRDTLDMVRLASSLLVTFAALVLGLLTSTVNTAFVTIGNDVNELAGHIRQTGTCLKDYGQDAMPIRAQLRGYVSSAIASTWPDETAPDPGLAEAPEVESRLLDTVLEQIRLSLVRLEPSDPLHARLATLCAADFAKVYDLRWKVVAEAHGSVSVPFYRVLVVMLIAVFASFGLSSPRNLVAWLSVGLAALTIAASLFVVLELDGPIDGLIRIRSDSMRAAMADLER